MKVNNVKGYALSYEYIVAFFYNGAWYFWGAWDDLKAAEHAAREQGGIVVRVSDLE